jgi:hypothetical protein
VTVLITLALGFLATARVTQFLVNDRLALAWRRWTIDKFGDDSEIAYMVHCTWCTSIWVALIVMPIALWVPFHIMVAPLGILAASYITGRLDKE